MKIIILLAAFFMSQNIFAATCPGVQGSQGLTAQVAMVDRGILVLRYSTKSGVDRKCVLVFDQTYSPRTPNPQKDRYFPSKQESTSCDVKQVMVSKSLTSFGTGYVDVESFCVGGGGCAHGDLGEIDSFYCAK